MVDESPTSRGEQTKIAIIQAAHDLFVRQGYHGTSMRQIARKAGIALGGVYNHFESKEAVFEAVFLENHPYQEVVPAVLQAQGETVEAIVRDAFARMLQALDARPDYMNLLFIEIVEFKNVHTRDLFAKLLPQILPFVQHTIDLNQERLRPIPALMLYRILFGMFSAYYLTEALFAEESPLEFRQDAAEYFVDVFLYGVVKSPEPGCAE